MRDGGELARNRLNLVNKDRDGSAGIVMDVVELLVKGEMSSTAVLLVFGCESFPSSSTGVKLDDDGLVDRFDKEIKEGVCLLVHRIPNSGSGSFHQLRLRDNIPISIHRKIDLNVFLECRPILTVELCDAGKEHDKPWGGGRHGEKRVERKVKMEMQVSSILRELKQLWWG